MSTLPEGPWIRRSDVLHRAVDDRHVVLPLEGDEPLALDGLGAVLWDLLAHPHTLHEIADLLGEATGASNEDIDTGLRATMKQLQEQRLVRVHGAT